MNTLYPDWLMRLEEEAATRLKGHRLSFAAGEFACPWLRWYFLRHRNKRPETVLILQDWDRVEAAGQSIMEAVRQISSPGGDRGIRNLFGREDTGNGLQDGTLCVMNAVWGLRPRKNTSRNIYLKNEVHAAAWPIWSEALRQLSPKRRVVTAGYWASEFDGTDSANQFLTHWGRWTRAKIIAPKLKGVSYEHWDHPSFWGAVR